MNFEIRINLPVIKLPLSNRGSGNDIYMHRDYERLVVTISSKSNLIFIILYYMDNQASLCNFGKIETYTVQTYPRASRRQYVISTCSICRFRVSKLIQISSG